jgi:acetyltransferase-like isoleucine patch superfamily enzyme
VRSTLRTFVDSQYRQHRGTDDGFDADLGAGDVVSFISRKIVSRVRGELSLLRSVYRGRRVEIVGRRHLHLGRHVSLGNSVLLDAVSRDGIIVGDQTTIDRGAILKSSGVVRNLGQGIRIGARTSVGAFNVILGQGGVFVGDDVLLGPGVHIYSENHNFDDLDVPIRQQGETRDPVIVGDNVWVGANTVILAGASIGDGSIVAAGSIVRGTVPPYSIVAGVPAKLVRMRDTQ